MLPSEFQSNYLFIAKSLPKYSFGFRLVFSKFTSTQCAK